MLRPDAAELRGLRRHAKRDRATSLLVGAGVLAALVAGVAGAPLVLAGGVLVGVAAASPGSAATSATARSCCAAPRRRPR